MLSCLSSTSATRGTAALIRTNQDYFAASPMVDGEEEIFKAYQSVFECLGVTCGDIGELGGESGVVGRRKVFGTMPEGGFYCVPDDW